MLEYYRITILGARDLPFNYPPSLYVLVNAYTETNLSKNDPEIAAIEEMDGPTYR
jgi:hypothetical protein